MAVDSLARRLAAAALHKGENEVTKDYVDSELEKKYDKTGGAITGDVAIQGNLTVSGTTTTEKEKQLLVEDNVIVTNANKIDLKALLSGLAINKNENVVYGIMYDPTDDTVKFGEGTLDENNKFTFKTGEGLPIAIREDSTKFTNAHLVKWDAIKNSFVDAGISATSVVTRDVSGNVQVGTPINDADATPKSFVEDNLPTVGTSAADNERLKAIYYTAEDEIPEAPEEGVEYAVVGFVGYSDLDSNLQEKIDNVPTWKTTAPTTDADKNKVQFTKVIISTTDDTNFPGMNGRYAVVPGFTDDGFHYGTVVCSQADPAYEFPFIGSITSEMASGTVIKPSVSPTYISVVNPQVSFTYEYLW